MMSRFALLLQGSVTHEYNLFFWAMVALCSTVGTGIAAFLIYCAWHYRRRSANELPSQLTRNIPAEVTWIALPTLLFITMFAYGVKIYFDLERPPDNSEDVYVVAKQWMWKTQHLGGQREIDTLHVPVGRAIRLNMISQDVIHSFFVPAFRIKQDVLPRRYTSIWFKATVPGTYHLFCAEYCGTEHSTSCRGARLRLPSATNRFQSPAIQPSRRRDLSELIWGDSATSVSATKPEGEHHGSCALARNESGNSCPRRFPGIRALGAQTSSRACRRGYVRCVRHRRQSTRKNSEEW
jgi:cytochrome c oxidase subunit II